MIKVVKEMKNKTNVTRKIVSLFIRIGEIHASSFSFGVGYYEPKVSKKLLMNSKGSGK